MGPIAYCCRSNKHREELSNFEGLDHQEIEEAEALIMSADLGYAVNDHNAHGDDVIKVKNYDRLDPYQKFEKEHPFYHMDVNGFCLHIRQAVILDLKTAGLDFE